METSDSECFESADEEFFSDDDTVKETAEKKDSNLEKGFRNLNIVVGTDESNVPVEQKNNNSLQSEKVTVNTRHIVKKESKQYEKKEVQDQVEEKLDSSKHILENLNVKGGMIEKDIAENDENLQIHIDKKQETDEVREPKEVEKDLSKIHKQKREVPEKPSLSNQIDKEKLESTTDNITFIVKTLNPVKCDKWEADGWEVDEDNIWKEEMNWPQQTSLESSSINKTGKHSSTGRDNTKEESSAQKQTRQTVEKDGSDTENMWDNDEWEPIEDDNSQNNPAKCDEKEENTTHESWGSWGTWGVHSIFTTATQGVSTLTNHVSQGLNTVLETSIGIPNPEELARQQKKEKEEWREICSENLEEDVSNKNASMGFGLGNLGHLVSGVSNLTKFVETTGTKVISGGLDTLETIGKKTMEVLQEGDPGLKKKRQFLKLEQNKPILSQVLREAKEKAEKENKVLQEKHIIKKKNYETLFDDHHGLVHLEALEMLSKQCDIKIQTLTEDCDEGTLTDIQETLEQVKELCELPDDEDEDQSTTEEIKEKLQSALKELNVNISYEKLISTWEETETWLNNLKLNICDENELHQQAIESLAQLTAIAVEQYHKAGELMLIKEHRSTADEADSLVQLTTTLTSLIGIVAAKFSAKLNMKASDKGNKDDINGLITNVFFEAANSSSYIQDAFQLLIPVLQVGAI